MKPSWISDCNAVQWNSRSKISTGRNRPGLVVIIIMVSIVVGSIFTTPEVSFLSLALAYLKMPFLFIND